MSRLGRHLGVFVGILAVILLVAAVGPAVLGPSSGTNVTAQSPEQYQPSNLQLDTIEESGSITVGQPAGSKTVAVDLAHSNDIAREDLRPLVSSLVEAGHEVRFIGGDRTPRPGSESSFNESLQDVDAFIVATPSSPFGPDQVAAVDAYAEADGRVLVLEETPSSGTSILGGIAFGPTGDSGVESQADNLASRFGFAFGSSYLYDMDNGDAHFKAVSATPAGSDGLLDGVDEVIVRDAVPVFTGDEARPLLETTESAALESTRERGPYPVLARNDNTVALGDATIFSPDSFREGDNEVLIGNLATFLVSGDKDPEVPKTESGNDRFPPRPTIEAPSDTDDGTANGTDGSSNETVGSSDEDGNVAVPVGR